MASHPDKIALIFGQRLHRRIAGKLATVIDQVEHGHHVYRAYFKHAFLKQYEKFATFLRNELCSNSLKDFRLNKGLDNLQAVRETFQAITDRFASYQAQWLNVHVDFALLQRLALPASKGAVRYPGIKIHDTRVIRLMEVLLHGGTRVGGWTAKEIHHAVLATFGLSDKRYRLNQLRYDLRKLKGHALLERDGSRYAYRLTTKGVEVALLFLFFHKRLCGPLANSRFHHRPSPTTDPKASSRRPTIAPMQPFRRSSICSPPDIRAPIVELFLSTILGARIRNIGAALEQVGGEAVAQRVQRHGLFDPGRVGRLVKQAA